MATVALFGGSFAPVHTGHIAVARAILEKNLADEVWLTPCKRNPLKEENKYFSDEERLNMLRQACRYTNELSSTEGLKVCEIELDMPSPSYTCNTVRRLQALYPGCRFRLVAGADSYLDFTQWRDWEWLEKNFSPVVYPRPGYDIKNLRPGWTALEDVMQTDISSTRLRALMDAGERVAEYMPWIIE